MNILKIILADAQSRFLNKLSAALAYLDGVEIIATITDSKQLLQVIIKQTPDILILDLDWPDADILEITKLIRKNSPQTQVLLLSVETRTSLMMDALQCGASGYLFKTAELPELHQAIVSVARGQVYIGDYFSREMARQYRRFFDNIHSKAPAMESGFLSERETQILVLIAQEFSNNEIAAKLYISPSTVETHRKHLIKKLGVRNSMGLVKHALRIGLIDLN